jgi:hypothetical protein
VIISCQEEVDWSRIALVVDALSHMMLGSAVYVGIEFDDWKRSLLAKQP